MRCPEMRIAEMKDDMEIDKVPRTRILLVEDNERFIYAAKQYFSTIDAEVEVDYAQDYDEAMKFLDEVKYDCVISDCFFPKAKGSNDKSLGKKTLKKLKELDFYSTMEDLVEETWKNMNLNVSEDLANRIRKFIADNIYCSISTHHYYSEVIEGRFDEARLKCLAEKNLERITDTITRAVKQSFDETKLINIMAPLIKENQMPYSPEYDSIKAIEEAMEKDESQQPLGILVIEKAREKGVKLITNATSEGLHGKMVTAINKYCSNKYFKRPFAATKEMPKDKPEYWERAYEWAKSPMMSF